MLSMIMYSNSTLSKNFPIFSRPVRGMGAVVLGAGPAHACYFGTYEHTKELLAKVTVNNNISYGKPFNPFMPNRLINFF